MKYLVYVGKIHLIFSLAETIKLLRRYSVETLFNAIAVPLGIIIEAILAYYAIDNRITLHFTDLLNNASCPYCRILHAMGFRSKVFSENYICMWRKRCSECIRVAHTCIY